MFKFKKKDKEPSARESTRTSHKLLGHGGSHKLLRTTSTEPVAEPAVLKSGAKYEDPAHQQRIARFNSTTSTMLSDDVEDVFYARGGTEIYTGARDTTASSSRGTEVYGGGNDARSTTSSVRSTDQFQYRMTGTSSTRGTEQLRSTGLETLSEAEEARVSVEIGLGNTRTTLPRSGGAIGSADADSLRAELAEMKQEMQAIKREMMNEMHLTRYDVLKEVTMLKGTIMQLVTVMQQSGGVRFDNAAATALGFEQQQTPAELSTDEKEALTRRTTTVTSKVTKERITSAREDQIPPIMRSSSRLTQLAPVADSALSTPLHQEQIDDMFPLVDCSTDVQVQARILETGSREWAFERVQEWLDSRFNVGADLVLAMVGDAGSGKTVAAAAISDKHHEQVVAQHFCKFDKKSKSSPRNVLFSLVNQLTTSLPVFKSQLARLNLKYVLEETDVIVLARKILVDPLNSLEEPLTAKFMLLDGLDQCRLPNGNNDLLEFLSIVIPECPQWVGFLVTSKPSPQLAAMLPVTSVLDFSAKNANYVNDTIFLINDIVAGFHDNDVAEAKEILKNKSGGNYAFLEFTKQALSHPGMEEHDGFIPVEVLLDLPDTVYEIYAEIFEDKFGKGRNRLWRKAQPVLELIVTAASGPYAQITEQQVLDSLSYTKDEVRMLRRAFIDIISIRHGTYHIVSSALFEWLTDSQRKGDQFFVDVNAGVQALRKFVRGEVIVTSSGCSNTPRTSERERTTVRSALSSTASSSSSSSDRSNGGSSGGSGSRSSTVPSPPKLHEPNLKAVAKPVGILKRSSSKA